MVSCCRGADIMSRQILIQLIGIRRWHSNPGWDAKSSPRDRDSHQMYRLLHRYAWVEGAGCWYTENGFGTCCQSFYGLQDANISGPRRELVKRRLRTGETRGLECKLIICRWGPPTFSWTSTEYTSWISASLVVRVQTSCLNQYFAKTSHNNSGKT